MRYETQAGMPTEGLTFSRLIDHLREAQECCYVMGHLRKANDDLEDGQRWLAIGENFKKMQEMIIALASGRLH